jgi:DNA-binding NarL/FixJ family response regulator
MGTAQINKRDSSVDPPRSGSPVGLIVVDDSLAFRRAISVALSRDPRVRLLGVAEDGRGALELLAECEPDVALVDLRMPGIAGADLIRTMAARFPGVRAVALTVSEGEEDLSGALRAGARGYVLKSAGREDVVRAALAAARGESWLSGPMAAKLIDTYSALPAIRLRDAVQDPLLSPRERSVLSYMAAGMKNRDIAAALGVAETTVKTHVKTILAKLGAASRSEAAAIAWRSGLAESEAELREGSG